MRYKTKMCETSQSALHGIIMGPRWPFDRGIYVTAVTSNEAINTLRAAEETWTVERLWQPMTYLPTYLAASIRAAYERGWVRHLPAPAEPISLCLSRSFFLVFDAGAVEEGTI